MGWNLGEFLNDMVDKGKELVNNIVDKGKGVASNLTTGDAKKVGEQVLGWAMNLFGFGGGSSKDGGKGATPPPPPISGTMSSGGGGSGGGSSSALSVWFKQNWIIVALGSFGAVVLYILLRPKSRRR